MSKADTAVLEDRVRMIRSLLQRDPDDVVMWFGLGRALADLGRGAEAVPAFRRATELDPDYTAAWRELGRAQHAAGEPEAAVASLEHGIELARRTGDLQTGREMRTFLRRARKDLDQASRSGDAR
jgi:Flp pilus assembly protein TadD